MLKSILVYCGANAGNKPIYTETAEKLGEYLGKNKIQLVYGGGKVGLMGVVSNAVLKKYNTQITKVVEIKTYLIFFIVLLKI